MNHEIKSGFLGYSSTNYVETYGYPNQQIYRYRSLPGDTDFFQRPDSVQVFDYPNDTNAGVNFNSWFVNDMINADAAADAERRRAVRSLLVVAARAGQSRHRARTRVEHLSGEPRLPGLQRVVAAPLADLRPDRATAASRSRPATAATPRRAPA